MSVKIAVFAREEVIASFNTLIDQQQDIEYIPFIYEKESETVELFEKAFMCDIYLFTEALSLAYVRDKIEKKRLPTVSVKLDEKMVLANLYYLKNSEQIKRLSIDIDNQDSIQRIIDGLSLNNEDIYIYDYGLDSSLDLNNIVSHHKKLWKENKIDSVLTSIKSVESMLMKEKIPVHLMKIPTFNLEEAIDEAKMKYNLNRSIGPQVVTGFIEIKPAEELSSQQLEEKMQKLGDILGRFCKKTDAAYFPMNQHQFVLFGTKAIVNHLSNHYRDFPLLKEIKSTLQSPVNIGYGLGLTAKQSEVNAKLALETCNKWDDGRCYIINERQESIGPIGIKKEFDASKLYQALIHKARLNNELSYNFIEFIRSRNNEPFSSNDIANFYNVTKRSAERTVNKLLSGKVIRVSGEERPYQKGRPRKLFTLNQ